MKWWFLSAAILVIVGGCASTTPQAETIQPADASGAPIGNGSIYVFYPCAPIDIVTGVHMTNYFGTRMPVFIDSKQVGVLNTCDVVTASPANGRHNVRIQMPLMGISELTSAAGISVTTGGQPVYVAMAGAPGSHSGVIDAETGQRYLSEVKAFRAKH